MSTNNVNSSTLEQRTIIFQPSQKQVEVDEPMCFLSSYVIVTSVPQTYRKVLFKQNAGSHTTNELNMVDFGRKKSQRRINKWHKAPCNNWRHGHPGGQPMGGLKYRSSTHRMHATGIDLPTNWS